MSEYASNAKANAGVALGIIGTALAGVAMARNNNGWGGGLFGTSNTASQIAQSTIADLNSQIAELKSTKYSDGLYLDLYKGLVTEDDRVTESLKQITQSMAEIATQVALNKQASDYENKLANSRMDAFSEKVDLITKYNQQLNGLADASIISYVNSTFLPGTLKLPVTSVSPQPLIPSTN